MSPSNTVFVRGMMPGSVPIRNLSTHLIQTLLTGTFPLSPMDVIGLQAESDRRREAYWDRYGRRSHRYVPYLTDTTAPAFTSGYFDIRFLNSEEERNYVNF